MRSLSFAALLTLVWSAASAEPAPSQSLELGIFRPAPAAESGLIMVESPDVSESGVWGLSLTFNHAVNPLRGDQSADMDLGLAEETGHPVAARSEAMLSFALALADRFEFGIGVPVLRQSGEDFKSIHAGTGTHLGDVSLHGKWHLLEMQPLSFGISVTGTVPTGKKNAYAGVDWPTLQTRGMAGVKTRRVEFAANAGVRLRRRELLLDVSQGNEITYGLAVSYRILRRLAAVGEIYGALGLSGRGTEGASPLEPVLGVRYRVTREIAATTGASWGVLNGIGAADFRGFMLLSYTPGARDIPALRGTRYVPRLDPEADKDRDGIVNKDDDCPLNAEDMDSFEDTDGCPDVDNDQDGLIDRVDKCPNEKEDKDGFKDNDGCPELDNDEDGVADAADQCPDVAEDIDGYKDDDGCDDPDNDVDGIPDMIDMCPLKPETINGKNDEDGCPDPGRGLVRITEDGITVLAQVRFKGKTAEILPSSENLLAQMAATLRAKLDLVKVRIRVRVRSRISGAPALSEKRAAAVRDWLVKRGVDGSRLETAGQSAKIKAKRDRVDFVLIERKLEQKP